MDDDEASRKTYRYVRIGMIGAVVLLGASVLLEHDKVASGCWQTSISAYYYTPVRAVFVGALIAIGLSLIVLKGATMVEDAALNVAGMLAPVVALVPTSDVGRCWSITPVPLPTVPNPNGDDPLNTWVLANIDNNVRALIFAGFAGLGVAAILAMVALAVGRRRGEQKGLADAWRPDVRGTTLGLVGALALLIVATLLFHHWDDFDTRAHGFAAILMFAALAVAVVINARECQATGRHTYAVLYLVIAALMVAGGGLMFLDYDHKVLAVELVEISLFGLYWSVQTRELWDTTVRPRSQ